MSKIIYFLEFVNFNETTSVLKKAIANVRIWRDLGHDAELVIHTNVGQGPFMDLIIKNQEFITIFFPNKLLGRLNLLIRKIGSLIKFSGSSQKKCLDYILFKNPDVVYHRMTSGNWLTYKVVENFKTVWEINTLMESEIKGRNSLLSVVVTKNMNEFFAKCASSALGMVSVTNEIANFYSNKFSTLTNDKILILPNTISTNGHKVAPSTISNIPQIAFMGSPNQSWQGEDLVEQLATKTVGKLEFHIIGFVTEQLRVKNITYYPYLSKDDYEAILAKCDVGIGTCALFRKNMKEACPLKVREYLNMGLPVILPYRDTAFPGDSLNFVLRVDNVTDSGNEIVDFCEHWKNKRVDSSATAPFISMEIAEEKKLHFIHSIL